MTPNSLSSGNESVPSPGTERSGRDPGSLFMDHWDRLRRMVEIRLDRRLHGRVDPSDVLQEAYIEFARSLPGFLRNPAIPMFLWLRHITGVRLKAVHRRAPGHPGA